MKNVRKQFDYKSRWTVVFSTMLFFGACAALFAFRAQTNDRGLVISGLLKLSPPLATTFYWILAAASMAFVLGGTVIAFNKLTSSARIALTDDEILIPGGRWKKQEYEVHFNKITAIKSLEANGEAFLYIYAEGLRYLIVRSMLPCNEDFAEISSILATKSNRAVERSNSI